MKKLILILTVLSIGITSCKKQTSSTSITEDKEVNRCESIDATYATVEPIFKANCVKCHTLPRAADGIDLNSYETTSSLANSGKLACVLKGESCKAMPPMGKLSDQDLLNMICWIKGGAPK